MRTPSPSLHLRIPQPVLQLYSGPHYGTLCPLARFALINKTCLPEELTSCDLKLPFPEANATSAPPPSSVTFILITSNYLKVLWNCLPHRLLTLGGKNNRLSVLFFSSFTFAGKMDRKCRESRLLTACSLAHSWPHGRAGGPWACTSPPGYWEALPSHFSRLHDPASQPQGPCGSGAGYTNPLTWGQGTQLALHGLMMERKRLGSALERNIQVEVSRT